MNLGRRRSVSCRGRTSPWRGQLLLQRLCLSVCVLVVAVLLNSMPVLAQSPPSSSGGSRLDLSTVAADAAGVANIGGACQLMRLATEATLRFGGLLELHDLYKQEEQRCVGFGGWATVQQSIAYNYMIDHALEYLKTEADQSAVDAVTAAGVTIVVGGLAFDTCGSGQLAVQEALTLAIDSEAYRNATLGLYVQYVPRLLQTCASLTSVFSGSQPLLGVIGPMTTSSVSAVSPFLSTFQVPHVTYWASSTLFDDTNEYSFLFRTVPSDEFQAAAIADLIEHFGWTYVSLVAAEDDDYSGRGFELLRTEATTRGTFCFAVESRYSALPSFRKQARKVVQAVKSSSARVVILYAPISPAMVFFDLCKELEVAEKIFVGSHDWINRMDFPLGGYVSRLPIIGLAPRTTASSTALQAVEDLRNSLKNASFLQHAVQDDPWLRAYIEGQLGCRARTSPGACSVLTLNASTPLCAFSDFERFQPRSSMVIAETLILGILASGLANFNLITQEDLLAYIFPSGLQTRKALENLTMRCQNFTSRCTVFGKQHRTLASYYIQNVQRTPAGFYDVTSIGTWETGNGFRWYPEEKLNLKSFGTFNASAANLTSYRVGNPDLPTSNCSQTCLPGQRRVFDAALPSLCCWSCAACAGATFSNSTNADTCTACPLGFGSDAVTCSPYPATQRKLSDAGELTVLCIAGIGFILTFASLVYFRRHPLAPLVRASDLTLTTISMVAMLVGHALVPIVLIPGVLTTTSCTLSTILPEPIKTVVVSSVLVKTKRFNTIFKSMDIISRSKTRRLLMGNPTQILFIVALTVINIVLILSYAFIDPPQALSQASVSQVLLFCDLNTLWVSILSVYNLVLLVVCIVLAFLTRNLPEGYNEAQLLYLASLTGFVVWLGLFPALIVTGDVLRPLISAIFLEGQLLAFWMCLYAPRVVQMIRKKKYRVRPPRQSTVHLQPARRVTVSTDTDLCSPSENGVEYVPS